MLLDYILVLLMMDSSCVCIRGCVTMDMLHISYHQWREWLFWCPKYLRNSAILHKLTCLSQQLLTLVCLMEEVCVGPTASMFAAVAGCSTLHALKGVITINYPTHTKKLTLHHLHNEFTRNLLLIRFHVTQHQRPNGIYYKIKYCSSTCGSLSWTTHWATGPHIPL